MTYGGGGRCEEDQRAEVGSSLVGESASSVDQSTDTVCLDGRSDDRATPRGGSGRGLLAVKVLLFGVGLLRAAVGITEDGAENGERDGVVKGRAKGDGRRLDGGQVYVDNLLAIVLCCSSEIARYCNCVVGKLGDRKGFIIANQWVSLQERDAIVDEVCVWGWNWV
jgi:hypothetical protein